MPLIRTSAPGRTWKLMLAAAALAVTVSGATVSGVSAAEERPVDRPSTAKAAASTPNNTAVTPLSRRRGYTDIVYVGAQGRIHADSRGPDGDWFTQFLNGGEAAPDTKVTGVSRYAGRLDVFAVGTDRQVWTAFLDEDVDGRGTTRWTGWFPVPGVKVNVGTSVNVVSTNTETMDLFTLDENQWQMTARWTAQAGWGTWRRLNLPDEHTRSVGTAEITATVVRQDTQRYIHVFAQERDLLLQDAVMTKRYVEGQGWSRWEELPNRVILPSYGSEIVPIVRVNALDIFVVQAEVIQHEGRTAWTANWNTQAWTTPTKVLDFKPRLGTSVHGVARNRARNLDVFAVDENKHVWTAAWTADGWRGWWPLDGEVADETSVTAISDGIDDIQIFAIGKNPDAVFPVWTRRWSSATGWTEWENVAP